MCVLSEKVCVCVERERAYVCAESMCVWQKRAKLEAFLMGAAMKRSAGRYKGLGLRAYGVG